MGQVGPLHGDAVFDHWLGADDPGTGSVAYAEAHTHGGVGHFRQLTTCWRCI